jgi:hypothetical protein
MRKKGATQNPTPPPIISKAPTQGPGSTPTSQLTETETQAPSLQKNDDSRRSNTSSSSSKLGALGVLALIPITLVGVIWYLWRELRSKTTTSTAATRTDQRSGQRNDQRSDPPAGSLREDIGRSLASQHRVGPTQDHHRHHQNDRSTGGARVLKPTFKNQCVEQPPPLVSAILVANENDIEAHRPVFGLPVGIVRQA